MKTIIYLIFSLFLVGKIQAQSVPKSPNKTDKAGLRQGKWTIIYNKDWKEISIKDSVAFYRLITYKGDKPVGKVKDYYKSGKVQMEAILLSDRPTEVFEGVATWYRENGIKEMERIFKNGKQDSEKMFDEKGTEITKKWKEIYAEGDVFYNKQDYKSAVIYYEQALPLAEKEFGKESWQYADTNNDTGLCYSKQGKYVEAEPFYIQSKNIKEKILGKEHLNYITSCDNLAKLYDKQRLYDKAEIFYIETKNLQEKVLGKEHADYIACCNNLANMYYEYDSYAKAASLFIEIKNIYEKKICKKQLIMQLFAVIWQVYI